MLGIQDKDVALVYSQYEQAKTQLIEKLVSNVANNISMSHFFERVLEYNNTLYTPIIEEALGDNQLVSKYKTKIMQIINFYTKTLKSDFKFVNLENIETYISSFHSNNDKLTTCLNNLKRTK